jgi:hypothetical protein
VLLNGAGKRDEATDQLIHIIRKERTWNDEAARKQLVQFFEAWGPNRRSDTTGPAQVVVCFVCVKDHVNRSSAMPRYSTVGDLPVVIPVFPLAGALLLPRTDLPLNIFEPRYLDDGGTCHVVCPRLIGMIQPAARRCGRQCLRSHRLAVLAASPPTRSPTTNRFLDLA